MPALPAAYRLSFEATELDLSAIHAFLSQSYWSPGVSLEVVQRAVAGSQCVGLFHGTAQVGFARAVSDCATFAYLADVYVLPEHRGQGLAQAMVGALMDQPALQGLRRWMLATRDAHTLYARLGFAPVSQPDRLMEIRKLNAYQTMP